MCGQMNDTKPALFAEERRLQILELLKENNKFLVPDLCRYFHVSPATIRNDLKELSIQGLLQRTHGGAIYIDKTSYEPTSKQKSVEHVNEKAAIGKLAATLVEDDNSLILDTGTTSMELAKYLCEKRNLTIILNDVEIAWYLEEHSDAKLILAGGSLRRGFHCCVGRSALELIRSLNVDKAFIGANGINLSTGMLSTPDMNQADVKRAMIDIASEAFLIADSSKLGNTSLANFADLGVFNCFITDWKISGSEKDLISNYGIDLMIAAENDAVARKQR